MGFLREKYTQEYFTGRTEDGNPAGYGIEGFSAFLQGSIRPIDLSILSKIDFRDKKVLEFGFGRGETIKYVLEHAASYYEGIDFAEPAIKIATEFLKTYGFAIPKLHCADALELLKSGELKEKFDIIIMFDFIEHIPRAEMREIFNLLHGVMNEHAIIAINTPVYRADNDVLTEGLKSINKTNMIDTSNSLPQTTGMHCNLYTIPSLHNFINGSHFVACSEAHFYIADTKYLNELRKKSYLLRWRYLQNIGYPLLGDYSEDILEYAYILECIPTWRTFSTGDLKGISLLMTDEYASLYTNGFHDRELVTHMKTQSYDNPTIFDVGGFIGMSSLIFAKTVPSAKILCFEPNPWNQNRILINFSKNEHYTEKIDLYEFALGAEDEDEEMLLTDSIDNGHSSTSQLINGDGTDNSHEVLAGLGFHNMLIPVRKLDSFVEKSGIIPNIIKLDIEGAEALFIEGAKLTIQKYKPVMYIEFHSIPSTFHSMRLLYELGYKIIVLKQEPDKRILAFAEYCSQTVPAQPNDIKWLQYELEDLRLNRHKNTDTISELFAKLLNMQKQYDDTQNQLIISNKQLSDTTNLNRKIQEQFNDIQMQLADTQNQLDKSEIQLADTRTQLSQSQTQLASTRNQLGEIQIQLANTHNQMEATQFQLTNTQRQLVDTQTYLNNILATISWKITKPLRAVKCALKK